ncbi:sorbosone dehydrogenase family protein [Bradyrhizobium sp. 40]|jgi:glucose/arabinose dehydrogenase|uniref:PQQ-dependent sugar dehydrogenase n=1 Tax=unclassified Bradyrhizobium TaxID=2631580 RepID=UPI001FFAF548|nr:MULTISPECIES: sorbosone dehydrogenase family protein [unclassified Bradyrhizobium]MCK1405040.1 sorbosone dehydrogenase family protein [Bradyrhizobium sp. 76]UPJ44265.1 sorbosone dehydrogenase family protein [Bradyrhizobium sp. 40]
MIRICVLAGILLTVLSGCDEAPNPIQYGSNPELPAPQRGFLPEMVIARPIDWGNDRPTVPQGYKIVAIATDLQIPRQTLVLPNGDILVAEGAGGGAPVLRPKDLIANYIKSLGKSSVKGGNRLTLLRDTDGDGVYEIRNVFADNLNAPYGLALINGAIYVANQDSLVRFDYQDGQLRANGPPATITELPSAINHHWTKAMAASPDGRFLYVGIGSNSNITERGMDAEVDRAMVWRIDPQTGAHKVYATGLRNPSALAIQPRTGQLWAAVNERDEIGPNLVPDYLTSVREGGFYGWPYSYWGQTVDPRTQPQDLEKVRTALRPDYSLGSHVAALGLAFSTSAMGPFAEGAFVGEHGSWNRRVPVGFKVVFVPFRDGRPAGEPIDFVSGFLNDDGRTRGRPVGVTIDPRGALIVADDLSNTVWRITPGLPRVGAASPPGEARSIQTH